MPILNWSGKDKVVNHHNDVPYCTLERRYVEGASESDNMIIHGDNLVALKALLPKYEGKIKCIYIDPPYNTGEEGWAYNDNVNDPTIKKWLGEVVGKEGEDFSRHDKWLCMMYPRLRLLQKLLSEDGVIFISIDNNELQNLKFISDEIFGCSNFVTMFAVENNPKGRKNNAFVSEGYEYCLLYCKNKSHLSESTNGRVFCDVTSEQKKDTRTVHQDKYGEFRQSKRQVSGINKSNALCKDSNSERCFTIYYCSESDDMQFEDEYDSINDVWFLSEPGKKLIEQRYVRYVCTNSQTQKPAIPLYSKATLQEKHANHLIFFKNDGTIYEKERGGTQQITSFLPNKRFGVDLMTESATRMLEEIFGRKKAFSNAKNVEFIQLLLGLIKDKNMIVLDSFAGSGTTAHAVLKMNQEDGGNRKFILVEMMDYAETITAERVRRVIHGYGEGKKAVPGTGGSFGYYELGEPLMVDNVLNEALPIERIREYVWHMEQRGCSAPYQEVAPIEENNPYLLGILEGTAVYFCYEREQEVSLDYALLHRLKTQAENYVIYADTCLLSAAELVKYKITFKKIPRDIVRL